MQPLRIWWHYIIDACIPPRKTEKLARTLSPSSLSRLRRPVSAGGIEALLPYDDPRVQALIWELKYYDSTFSAKLLSEVLAEEIPGLAHETLAHLPLLMPIPLHPKRKAARGYNQTERVTHLAASLAAGFVEHAPNILVRTTDTPRQTALSRAARLQNVAGAFKVKDRSEVMGRVCILVDDVVTTGSTLKAAGAVLLEAGASRVILLALTAAG